MRATEATPLVDAPIATVSFEPQPLVGRAASTDEAGSPSRLPLARAVGEDVALLPHAPRRALLGTALRVQAADDGIPLRLRGGRAVAARAGCVARGVALLATAATLAVNVWALALFRELAPTPCKKLAGVVGGYGITSTLNMGVALINAALAQSGALRRDAAPGGDATLSLMACVYMLLGFAVAHGVTPWRWGRGATNPERCGGRAVMDQTAAMFDVAFSLAVLSCALCCAVVVAGVRDAPRAMPVEP